MEQDDNKNSLFMRLRRYFLSGLIVFLPVVLTIYLFIVVVNIADGLLGKFIEPYFREYLGFYIHGLGILIAVYIIILIGFFATNFLGKKIYETFEKLLMRLPFFRQVYPALKEMALFLFSRDRLSSFKQVVLVQYPRQGIYSFGFLTNETSVSINEFTGQETCNVFIPSAPGPLTGYVILVPKKDVIFTTISIEDAIKFILSGGVVNPPSQMMDRSKK